MTMILRDALCVTAFGKIDRAAIALLAAEAAGPLLHCGSAPRTAFEMEIAAIWRDVLACEIVPGDVAFLEMGGNSLQAVQILVHVRERPGVDMGTADFFALPLGGEPGTIPRDPRSRRLKHGRTMMTVLAHGAPVDSDPLPS